MTKKGNEQQFVNKPQPSTHRRPLSARWKDTSISRVLGSGKSPASPGEAPMVLPLPLALTVRVFEQHGGKTGSFQQQGHTNRCLLCGTPGVGELQASGVPLLGSGGRLCTLRWPGRRGWLEENQVEMGGGKHTGLTKLRSWTSISSPHNHAGPPFIDNCKENLQICKIPLIL